MKNQKAKRPLALLLAGVLIATIVAGCGSKSDEIEKAQVNYLNP